MLIKLPNGPFVNPSEVASVDKNENDDRVVIVATVDGKVHRAYVSSDVPYEPEKSKAAQQKLLDEVVSLINGPKLASPVSLRGFTDGPWVDLQAQLDNLKAVIDKRHQIVRDFSDSLKGGQGTTPAEGEVRPAAPPSPPMKSVAVNSPDDTELNRSIRLEVLKLAVSHVVTHIHSEPMSPTARVESIFTRFMSLITKGTKETPSA